MSLLDSNARSQSLEDAALKSATKIVRNITQCAWLLYVLLTFIKEKSPDKYFLLIVFLNGIYECQKNTAGVQLMLLYRY